jgi:hypothetical protein
LTRFVENHFNLQFVMHRNSRGGWLRPMRRDNVAAAQKEAVSRCRRNGDKLALPGATKGALKAAPEFDHAN